MRLLPLLLLLSTSLHAQRPDIIFIMSDDHDKDAISAYTKELIRTPNIDRLAREGMQFNAAFVANAICAPARATLLTGQHSHINGQTDNRARFDSSRMTLPKLFQQGGYQTAVIGKWHLKTLPSGFDFWKIVPGQGLYFQPRFIRMNNDTVMEQGYATDVITNEAIEWLEERDKSKPYLLLLHHKAPHRYFFPPLHLAEKYRQMQFPEPPSLYLNAEGRGTAWQEQTMSILPDMKLSSDLKVDPAFLMDLPHLRPDSAEIAYYRAIMNRIPQPDRNRFLEIYRERGELIQKLKPQGKELLRLKYQWYLQDYLACVASIDENVGKLLDYLDRKGTGGNTVVIYTSDQGFYLGQNGWFDKRFMYDQSMQVPLLVRWPGKTTAGSVTSTPVQNIDLAPTFLDMAGLEVPQWMQGRSWKNLLSDPGAPHHPDDQLYYHFYEYQADHTVLPHLGIRGRKWKLIYFYTVNEWEMYDLEADPDELNNLYGRKQYRKKFKQLKRDLVKLRSRYKDTEPAGKL